MIDFMVQLSSVADIKRFVHCASQQDFDIRIVSGRQIINAKSIMGIFSLELSKPLRVEIEPEGYMAECDDFQQAVKDFVITDQGSCL